MVPVSSSASMSSAAAETVTLCGESQLDVVNVSVRGIVTVMSVLAGAVIATVTSPVG